MAGEGRQRATQAVNEAEQIMELLAELDLPRVTGPSARDTLRLEMVRLKSWIRRANKAVPLTRDELSATKRRAGEQAKGRKGSRRHMRGRL